MKIKLILFLLLFSFGAFGQSAKKLNKQLLAEFAVEQQKQDSALVVFEQANFEFASLKMLTNTRIQLLADKEHVARTPYLKLFELTPLLKELGIDPISVIPENSKVKELPDYRRSFLSIKEIVKTEVKFDKVSSRLYLDLVKRKEQNSMLTEKLAEYHTYSKSNEDKQREMQSYIDKLYAFSPRVDSLIAIYQKLGGELSVQQVKLESKLAELKANYGTKVTKGVPDCPECDVEYVRVIQEMPNWIPGKMDGKSVNSVFHLPISIHLN
jgi:hypothetical protein